MPTTFYDPEESKLEKKGQENYLKHLTESKGIKAYIFRQEKLHTMLAITFASLALYPCVAKAEAERLYFDGLCTRLENQYEFQKSAPLEESIFDWSVGWYYNNALKKALQLVCDDPSFKVAWQEKDRVNCRIIAEKIMFVQFAPNALRAIKKQLDMLSQKNI